MNAFRAVGRKSKSSKISRFEKNLKNHLSTKNKLIFAEIRYILSIIYTIDNITVGISWRANKQLTTWFQENYMVLNPEKCLLMSLSKKKEDEDNCLALDNVTLTSSTTVTLLGKKTSQKLNSLTRLCNIISFPQKKIQFNSFTKSQYNYRPLICIPRIIYRATVTNESSSETRKYIGLADTQFKERYRNHTKDFNHKKYVNNTELAKYVWSLKDSNIIPIIKWEILSKVYGNTKQNMCKLCLTEKLWIINSIDDENLLNKKSEFMNKCRHYYYYLRIFIQDYPSVICILNEILLSMESCFKNVNKIF